jgi:hypothetical protein
MKYEQFEEIILDFKHTFDQVSELYDLGFNILDGKYPISENYSKLFKNALSSHYGDGGFEWIDWFVIESGYGENDLEAFDNGEKICYSIESLWEYLEKNHKI